MTDRYTPYGDDATDEGPRARESSAMRTLRRAGCVLGLVIPIAIVVTVLVVAAVVWGVFR